MNENNKYTLITGGTEGIGLELAKIFAMNNNNLIIVARNIDKLQDVKNKFVSFYKIKVEVIQCDLSVKKDYENIIEFVEDNNIIVDNLINCAGIGSFGFFHESESGFEEKIININIVSLTNMTKYFLSKMVKRNEGGILNVASTAAFVGGPKMSIYYASKAYVLSLTEAIHDEVKNLDIRISCLCPGPVKTEFQKKANINKSKKAEKYLMDAKQVAKEGYDGFIKGRAIIIPGWKNKILVLVSKLIPRSISRNIVLRSNS